MDEHHDGDDYGKPENTVSDLINAIHNYILQLIIELIITDFFEMATAAIFWFRNDLRLIDNPALSEAVKAHKSVIPLYIHDAKHGGSWSIGSASKWWLHHSLENLAKEINLIVRAGDSLEQLLNVIEETGAQNVYWNRRYEPFSIEIDTKIKKHLEEIGVEVTSVNGTLLFEPWEIKNLNKSNYKVFTAYWNACLRNGVSKLPLPKVKPVYSQYVATTPIADLQLLPIQDWAKEFAAYWQPGEDYAINKLEEFIKHKIDDYTQGRNFPIQENTSHLSPHLHFGEISPLYIWHRIKQAEMEKSITSEASVSYLREIGWREFSYYLLYHYPDLPDQNWRKEFDKFPWQTNVKLLHAWQKGMTGYPIVDAGMRELWQTGYMHNRVRMIVASFLTKHLLIDWQEGEKWFWDTLVDADLANNSCSWQWVAGSGADAAPYYRIFNPILQGEKFDPNGDYVRRWVPELSQLPNQYIHTPWLAPDYVLAGSSYPRPIVDHQRARQLALESYKSMGK